MIKKVVGLLLVSCPCWAVFGSSPLATCNQAGNASSASCTITSDAGASLEVIAISAYSGASGCTLSDSNSSTWSSAVTGNSLGTAGQQQLFIYFSSAPVTGSNHSFTYACT